MGIKKTLAERLAQHPGLEERGAEFLNIVETPSGTMDASDKMEEHYGVNVPASSVRAITMSHAQCMKEAEENPQDLRQPCMGESKQLIGEMDGSFVPIVEWNENWKSQLSLPRHTFNYTPLYSQAL